MQGTAIAASDGSFFPVAKVAACSWIVSTPDLQEYIQGGCVVPGEYKDHSAYRGEIGGQLGIAFFFHHFRPPDNHPIPTISIQSTIENDILNYSLVMANG